MTRRTIWTTAALVEEIAFNGHYDVEAGHDSRGDYIATVTREGTMFAARIAAAGELGAAVRSA